MRNVPLPSVQLQQSLKRNNCPVKGPSMVAVAVAGWETQRVRGWLQKALGDLCSTFLFLGEGCFGKREFAGNPILPGITEISKGDVPAADVPPPHVGFFPVHTAHSLPQQTSWSAPSSFHSTSSAIFEYLSSKHHIRKPHHFVYVAEWLHCAVVFVVFTSLKKNFFLRACVASKWEQELDGWERQWQTEQDWEDKRRSLWGGNNY